ncbi:RagB/SusD family nutrient uptake outer membrane protein [Parapedobacter deserti]|uniref:RagB/SusD family nutrient uptake outer membrane protein n=1 Tax=Parapedobacter deserti TaxID=1912957 RepID=A0ABV7JSK5_9SPHI
MKSSYRFLYSVFASSLIFAACSDNILDRPPLTQPVDDNFWRNETDIRLFANGFYPQYFVGYNNTWGVDYTPVRGYTFSDDLTSRNVQGHFENNVPTSRGATTEGAAWLTQYAGPNWNFAWVRKSNVFINRLENVAQANLTPDAYNHWLAVARFFRGFEYSRLVSVFGDVPYYGAEVADNDWDELYKDRDDRGVVMDHVYNDFRFVMDNIRLNDGANVLNKYIAASFIARLMLFEGTFQHYHDLSAERAKRYLELAVEAAEFAMNGPYSFTSDFKSLFASENLANNREVIMYRAYDAGLGVTHHIGSYNNGTEGQGAAANLVLVKSFICNDGEVWQNSSVEDADSFSPKDLALTRDPRFEATFIDRPHTPASSLLYTYKFVSREALNYIGGTYPPAWGSNTNTNDAPVIRLAEVVLNWLEAKAVLAEFFGGAAVTQEDLDRSVNAIRNRPLDDVAISKGVKKTAPLQLGRLPVDPARDPDVSPLIWEIRRERRMEFFWEYSRLLDLKRWRKIQYMDFSRNPDYFLGVWVDIPSEVPGFLTESYVGLLKVKKQDGTIVTYNGNNAANMVGFFMIESAANRNAFDDRVYMAPVGQAQIVQYQERGYTLSQTQGWN